MPSLTQKETRAKEAGHKSPSHFSLLRVGEVQTWALFSRSKRSLFLHQFPTRTGTLLALWPSRTSSGSAVREEKEWKRGAGVNKVVTGKFMWGLNGGEKV